MPVKNNIIVFRCDASVKMGVGHVMRCLTLAEQLSTEGCLVHFICRQHEGHLIELIERKGFSVFRLDTTQYQSGTSDLLSNSQAQPLFHADWLGASQEQDAAQCQPILEGINPDWLVVDHYALDYRWQSPLKKHCHKLMVIDDLADRKHECDLLLDQTSGRKSETYQNLVPEKCKLLLGAQYAMLRSEFTQWRSFSLKRRTESATLNKILITMGGIDQDNITGKVLSALENCIVKEKALDVIVVMGSRAPQLKKIKEQIEGSSLNITLHVDAVNMAELMASADLAIGAAGTTTWERCCLGLPSLMLVLAKNQECIADNVVNAGGALNLDVRLDYDVVCKQVEYAANNLLEMSRKSSLIVDGNGVSRVAESLL